MRAISCWWLVTPERTPGRCESPTHSCCAFPLVHGCTMARHGASLRHALNFTPRRPYSLTQIHAAKKALHTGESARCQGCCGSSACPM
eukprot:scaffold23341_cov18-Tisochrysis_lutea.AAC.3